MITRPVARWIVFGICFITMIASFFMTVADDKSVTSAPIVGTDKPVKQ